MKQSNSIVKKINFILRHYIQRPLYQKFVMLAPTKKIETIRRYAFRNNCDILIETGTFMGETIYKLKDCFRELHSFELQSDLAEKAKIRFKHDEHIHIYQGDSTDLLGKVLDKIDGDIIFWLDAHYSNEFWSGDKYIVTAKGEKYTPIIEELGEILSYKSLAKVILIDDARCFNGENDYPTKNQLIDFLVEKGIQRENIVVKKDIIRIKL